MKAVEFIKRVERVDQLIRLKATGSPKELAARLEICESSLYQLLQTMKSMGAEIYYCTRRRSYCYKREMQFFCGFKKKDGKFIVGGKKILTLDSNFYGVASLRLADVSL